MIQGMRSAGLAVGDPPEVRHAEGADHADGTDRAEGADDDVRLRALVAAHFDLCWRTLRRLGVPQPDLDDAVQQVFVVTARKLSAIGEGSERPFLLQTAVRVASDWRRTHRRRREVVGSDLIEGTDLAPGPDELVDRRRARVLLDTVLDAMPLPLRAVFVLYEIEELPSSQIAKLLGLPPGTVASRLRRARAEFQEGIQRLENLRAARGGVR
jgi:RNA polymerase sigma-70 factor, ECF subfamily